jgi:pyruvate dehydrogenase E1 component alpha subunit
MHLADFAVGSLGESGIVGGMIPIAVGAGLSARLRGTNQVCLCFFGDGAANEGTFHESLNLAAVWKLPVIFLCENNGYAMFTSQAQSTAVAEIASRAGSYSMPGEVVDGQDVLAVHERVSVAASRARHGEGPTLVEVKTYRYKDHSEFGHLKVKTYRSDDEVAAWRARDPIQIFTARLRSAGLLSDEELQLMRSAVSAEVEDSVKFAQESPLPSPEALFEDLYA